MRIPVALPADGLTSSPSDTWSSSTGADEARLRPRRGSEAGAEIVIPCDFDGHAGPETCRFHARPLHLS